MTTNEQTHCIELSREYGVYARRRTVNGERGIQLTGLAGIGHLVTSVYAFATSYMATQRKTARR